MTAIIRQVMFSFFLLSYCKPHILLLWLNEIPICMNLHILETLLKSAVLAVKSSKMTKILCSIIPLLSVVIQVNAKLDCKRWKKTALHKDDRKSIQCGERGMTLARFLFGHIYCIYHISWQNGSYMALVMHSIWLFINSKNYKVYICTTASESWNCRAIIKCLQNTELWKICTLE